ncbi:Mycothiol acetyltransferase [Sphingomonas sp. S2M10]|uniref:GNAT family N-acetyltransferase n=1 Tax=Sphingomonas sp. S2M10 TaxID=2705010 RepID=UPI00145698A8|nr:GNAT family N-acetyltransferase [Sphingomonas sp. S2M10]NLS27059.1 Mycothiol acetyltransferase [Sphingomonas sp. S2M10]
MTGTPAASFAIRPAIPAERDQLGRLGAQMVAVHHGFDARRFIAPTPETPQAYGGFLVGQIGRADAVLRVAVQGESVLGYVYAGVEGNDYMALRGPAGVIYDLIVAPEARRQGIGRALLTEAVEALRARGVPRLVLFTAERNAEAQALFGSIGFHRTMVEMTRDLPDPGGPQPR